nr:MAG TPA: hypothetical protein [Caudoviricetes sp.]
MNETVHYRTSIASNSVHIFGPFPVIICRNTQISDNGGGSSGYQKCSGIEHDIADTIEQIIIDLLHLFIRLDLVVFSLLNSIHCCLVQLLGILGSTNRTDSGYSKSHSGDSGLGDFNNSCNLHDFLLNKKGAPRFQ